MPQPGTNGLDWALMIAKFLRTTLVLSLSGCAAHSTHPASTAANKPSVANPNSSPQTQPQQDVKALFARELDTLPPLAPVSGQGWSAQVPGRNPTVKAGTAQGTEEISFVFEDSGPVECMVFADSFDPGGYVGNVVEELKKTLEVVGFTPTRFTVEQEIPAYFTSVLYHKKLDGKVAAGQLKLALGLHPTRPIVCLHDVPGYTATFESAARAVFSNFRVKDYVPPVAVTIGVARVGTTPIGFTSESASELDDGRVQVTSLSTQIVPRSANELMISDEAEIAWVAKSKVQEAKFVQADLHGEKLNLTLKASGAGQYKVSGTLGSKPTDATLKVKGGLPSSEATSLRLKQELAKNKSFRFTQPEYHPALDPTDVIQVSYSRAQQDKPKQIHVGLGQLELLATVDDNGEQIQTEMKAGSQTITFERLYHRDDRNRTGSSSAAKKTEAR